MRWWAAAYTWGLLGCAGVVASACSSGDDAGGCQSDVDCKGERVCVSRECVDPTGSGGTSSGTGGSTSTGGGSGDEPLCDTWRDGWCSCYQGPGARDWWFEESAVDSCTGYSCCYTAERAADTQGCYCSNDASCPPDFGVPVGSCPGGFSSSGSGGSGTGGGGTVDYCGDCLSTCSGLPGCCTGCGCMCESECGDCF